MTVEKQEETCIKMHILKDISPDHAKKNAVSVSVTSDLLYGIPQGYKTGKTILRVFVGSGVLGGTTVVHTIVINTLCC